MNQHERRRQTGRRSQERRQISVEDINQYMADYACDNRDNAAACRHLTEYLALGKALVLEVSRAVFVDHPRLEDTVKQCRADATENSAYKEDRHRVGNLRDTRKEIQDTEDEAHLSSSISNQNALATTSMITLEKVLGVF